MTYNLVVHTGAPVMCDLLEIQLLSMHSDTQPKCPHPNMYVKYLHSKKKL